MRYNGVDCGRAVVRREGLYIQVECDSAPVTDQIVRAYLTGGSGQVGLGVLVPEDGRLRLRRKLAVSQLPGEDFEAVRVTAREDDWIPWEGEIAGIPTHEALTRTEQGRQVVALPFSSRQPFAHMAVLLRCTPLWLEGRRYMALTI